MNTDDILSRVIRYDDMQPCKTAFIDARTPGSDKKENFCLIGGGVAENPGQIVHIDIPHRFNVGAAKQPHGCKNSHHSHDTAEVFFVHRGKWQFTWGPDGEDGQLVLDEGATISIPTQVFRGFENVGDDDGFLYAVLGLDESGTPGHVVWAPYVIENAKSHGLILLEDGRLLDTVAGDSIPPDATMVAPLQAEELQKFHQLSTDDMSACVQHEAELREAASGGLSLSNSNNGNGISECAVLGVANPDENIAAGKINWNHDFQIRRLQLQPATTVPAHTRAEEEVLFLHRGSLEVQIENKTITLNQGDLVTVPINASRTFSNNSQAMTDIVVIRGGDHPQAAQFT